MFQSEHLVEKWAPLLEHEGCESIKDNHRKAVTAVLLENQEKFLKEQNAFSQSGSFLSEQPTNAVGNGGFTGGAADAGPVAGFDPVLISLIRRSMPNLVAYDLAGVQPMSGPTGLIFAMRSKYNDQTGPETFFDEVDTAFSGQNATGDSFNGHSGATVGMGTTAQGGTNPGLLNPTATATETDYNVGQGMRTDDAESLGTSGNEFRFSVQTMDCLEVLCQFQGVLSFECSGLSGYSNLLDAECHLVEGIVAGAIQRFSVVCTHTLTDVVIGSGCGCSWVEN